MAQRFGMVESSTWRPGEGTMAQLGTDARVLFLWSWTNPEAAICGLYTASLRTMARAVDVAPVDRDSWRELEDRVFAALDDLAHHRALLYDDHAEVVWVVNRASKANRSPKTRTAMRREYRACPPSDLKDQFAAMYGDLLDLHQED